MGGLGPWDPTLSVSDDVSSQTRCPSRPFQPREEGLLSPPHTRGCQERDYAHSLRVQACVCLKSTAPVFGGSGLPTFPIPHQSHLLAGAQGSTDVACRVPGYFQALLGLQASEVFRQVAGPPECPPPPEEQAPRGVDAAGMWNVDVPGVWFQRCLPSLGPQDRLAQNRPSPAAAFSGLSPEGL